MQKFGDEEYSRKKNRNKRIRVVLQIIILILVAILLAYALFVFGKYKPYQTRADVPVNGDHGFVAISYFGIDRLGNSEEIGKERLREHLQALKDSGFETITQQDIIDYYSSGTELPQKALFLMFEDGKRDSGIFAQKILEDLNYKATVLTYPEKFLLVDNKFLMPKEIVGMQKNTFWELGTNGYRLAFINAFDRYENYLGELVPLKHSHVLRYLGRKYNHYLMDYVRDKDGFPKESYNMMQDRVSYDYEKLSEVYTKEVGYVPRLHVLMHANTGAFGNNREVSAVNEKWILELFEMNFNREGYCWNDRTSSIYDLTRMQPQSYWYTNHLLMRIKHDQEQDVKFVNGREDEAFRWAQRVGVSEFKADKIILTTEPMGRSVAYLKGMPKVADLHASVKLKGSKSGAQALVLRANDDLSAGVAIRVYKDELFVYEHGKEIFNFDLRKLDPLPRSLAEDKKAARVEELKAFVRYASTKKQAEIYTKRLLDAEKETVPTVEDGAEPFYPEVRMSTLGNRKLDVYLNGHKMMLLVDGKEIVRDLYVDTTSRGKLGLIAAWSMPSSMRNLTDDVYDGVFENLLVTDYDTSYETEYWLDTELWGQRIRLANPLQSFMNDSAVYYHIKPSGWEGVLYDLRKFWEGVLNLFLHNSR